MRYETDISGEHMAFVNAMRLTGRQWLLVAAIVLVVLGLTPWVWKKIERFPTGADYRMPYHLSKDYWLYERRLQEIPKDSALVLGDSVVWGEYVAPDGTLSHFLNVESRQAGGFANVGVNGLFPLALEGLVTHYGRAIHGRKVILHCNLLWMSSPKADLQTKKEERFNHARLVPQFSPRIPCYRADASERIGIVMERNVPILSFVNHLQSAFFNQKSVPDWTLEADASDPARRPNAYKNPFREIRLEVPAAPEPDPDRGPASPRHRAWSEGGEGNTTFDWVTLESSIQWAAFQRLVKLLRARGNDVLVVVGPFNEHMMTAASRESYRRLRDGVVMGVQAEGVAIVVPEVLPSALYADASHPLTDGYHAMARRISADAGFQAWAKPR